MSAPRRAYRFRTAAQWQRVLASGFDLTADGTLEPIARLGATALPFTTTGPVSLVSVDPFGTPVWRLDRDGSRVLVRRTEQHEASRGFAIDGAVAHAPRWVIDREWLWVFDGETAVVSRYEADTLEPDRSIEVRHRTESATWSRLPAGAVILDIASDGSDGLWLLLEVDGPAWWLLHLDCQGCPRELHPLPLGADCASRRAWQLGTASRGTRLIVLTTDGRLLLLDAATGTLVRTVTAWSDDPCWRPVRLATDVANRVAMLSHHDGDVTRWAVALLDAEGDAIDEVTGPQSRVMRRPNDLATSGAEVWLAADDGLWRLDSSEASIARASESTVVTPALQSPEIGGGGWLRAELDVTLPRGAVVEAEAVATDRADVVQRATALAADRSRTIAQRQEAIWNLFEHAPARIYRLTAPAGTAQPVAIPLFHVRGRWLWLRLKLVTPPGEQPPALGELRVFYPDASIVQQLPAVFRGEDNDPTGFLRSLVGVLETTTQGIDDRIATIPAQIDPGTAPEPWLDYVARWLELPWDDALAVEAKRRVLRHAGELLEHRGTRRGLVRLLQALSGDRAVVRITDVTVEQGPTRLGGRGCPGGARLPMLLTGAPLEAPLLGTRTVLGRARLGAAVDPLAVLKPVLRIEIAAARAVRERLEPLLAGLLDQYVPAGIRAVVTWRTTAAWLSSIDPDGGEVLDATGPGRLGEDTEIGRVVLTGRRGRRLDGAGLDVGYRLS